MDQEEFNKMLERAVEDKVITFSINSDGIIVIKNKWLKKLS